MATRNQNQGSATVRPTVGMRVPTQRYGLIEWNGLCGFVSYGLEPAARTGGPKEPGERPSFDNETEESIRHELGRVSEPMN